MLRHLGFAVVPKGEQPDDEGQESRQPWSEAEVNLLVADYFDMLRAEFLGQSYNKAQHRRTPSPQLNGRSDGSIEFKHQNVSAVLVDRGLPYIEGYKPRSNDQGLLVQAVDAYLENHPDFS